MTGPTQPVIQLEGASKTFDGRTVLRGVDLDVQAGEVHALLGQNGSGKSTLIKILSGYHEPDPGARLRVHGLDVPLPLGPGDPVALGMSFVHQDLALAPSVTVLENLRIGTYRTGVGWRIGWKRERHRVREALRRFGLDVSPDALIGSLGEAERAMVAIVRAFEQNKETGRDHGLLVLDEPTASLPYDSVERLFVFIREVTSHGIGVLFVSHRIDEVRSLADRVTVLRDGERVASANTAELSEADLITHILGRGLTELSHTEHSSDSEVALRVRGLSGSLVNDVSFELRRGEILGLTGLHGMGHEQVPYLLFGAERARGGTVDAGTGTQDARRLLPRKAMRAGLVLVPGNRLRDGAVAAASVTENVTLPTLGDHFKTGWLRKRDERNSVGRTLVEYGVTPPEPRLPLGSLSGGNQQKALLAKWFRAGPRVLLLHEPTQGVDIGARQEILERIRNAAGSGTAVLLVSGETDDLARLCDRVIVFRRGWPVAELKRAELSSDRIIEQCFRTHESSTASGTCARSIANSYMEV